MFRRRHPIAMVVLVALAALPAAAHEYWLQPGRYSASVGDTVIVNAFVGEGFTGARLAYDPSRAERLTMHAAGAPRDLAHAWRPAAGAIMGCAVAPDDSGAVVAYLSRFTSIEIEPDRFDTYLREEGLDGPLAARAALPEGGGAGRERYRRCAKTWISPGRNGLGAQRATGPVGLPLEIVPLGDPVTSRPLRLEVRFQGAPLAGALVRAWHAPLDTGGQPLDCGRRDPTEVAAEGRTDAHGRVELRLDAAGEWLIGTVHMVPCQEPAVADWESYWASLTFATPR